MPSNGRLETIDMTQQPLMIVRAWQKKSSEVSTKSNDRLLSAVNKGFHAMVAVLSKDSDPDEVHCALDYLNSERSIALKYDKAKDDPLREVVYGLLESLHVSLIDWTEERNQSKETVEIFTSSEGVTNPSPTSPIEPKEEPIDIHEYLPQDYQISASEIMRDENMFKDEEMDNENMEGITANSHVILANSLDRLAQPLHSLPLNSVEDSTDISQILPHKNRNSGMGDAVGDSLNGLNEDDSALRMMQPSDIMDYQMNYDHEIYREEVNVLANYEIDNGGEEEKVIDHSSETQKDTPDSSKVEKKKRLSRNVPRPVRYNESMDDSDGDTEPSLKKSRSDSTKKADNKRRSQNDDDDSGDVCKKSGLSKVNETELECPQCEYRTQNVTTWITHLRRSHSTNPALAGLALLCECGHESLSSKHWEKTKHVNTIVIRKRDGPIKRMDDEKATPQCVLCEIYPKTAYGYTLHLNDHHKSTLLRNGVYLVCSCGYEVRSSRCRTHLEGCDPRQFTLHKLDGEKVYPTTARGYIHHLYNHHKSTLKQKGVYLVCSCGLEVRSDKCRKHLEDCDPHQFTLHKLDDN